MCLKYLVSLNNEPVIVAQYLGRISVDGPL